MAFDVQKFTGEGKPIPTNPLALALVITAFLLLMVFGTIVLLAIGAHLFIAGVNLIILVLAPIESAFLTALLFYMFLHFVDRYGAESFFNALFFFNVVVGLAFSLLFWPFLFVSLPVLGIYIVFKKERERAARFLSMTVRIMVEEEELMLPTFVLYLIAAYLIVGYLGFLLVLQIVAPGIISLLFSLLIFLFIMAVLYYALMGIVVGITYIWYRGKDPNLMNGINLVVHRLDKILAFSIYAAFFYFVRIVLFFVFRNRIGQMVLNYLAGIIWGVVNYFSLQTVVITNRRPAEAIVLSSRILVNNIPDVLIKEIFADTGARFISQVLTMAVFVITVVIGWVTHDASLMGIFLMSGGVIISIAVGTMETVYRTFLFSWALEKEFNLAEHGRIPKGMEEIIALIQMTRSQTQSGGPPSEPGGGDTIAGQFGLFSSEKENVDWSYLFRQSKQ
jgi:hypothetical protein